MERLIQLFSSSGAGGETLWVVSKLYKTYNFFFFLLLNHFVWCSHFHNFHPETLPISLMKGVLTSFHPYFNTTRVKGTYEIRTIAKCTPCELIGDLTYDYDRTNWHIASYTYNLHTYCSITLNRLLCTKLVFVTITL